MDPQQTLTDETPPEPAGAAPPGDAGDVRFERLPIIAHIETDRFCQRCSYNMRTQAVRRDPRTELLLARCPECGRFDSVRDNITVRRLWVQRLAAIGLMFWMLSAFGAYVWGNIGQAAINYVTLEELTRRTRTVITPATANVRARYSYGRAVRERGDDYVPFMAAITAASFALAFATGTVLVVAFHHWPRWVYPVVALSGTVIATFVVRLIWLDDSPHLIDWGMPRILYHGGVQCAAGLAGVLLGRPLSRLAVIVLLPPRLRPALSFLWLADGKPPPSVADRARRPT